jgi:protocatechuate 3,4-dioxygenase beta subunit
MAWLVAIITGGGLFCAETQGAEAQTPAIISTLRGRVLNTNGEPIANAIVTLKKALAGRGTVYVDSGPDCDREEVTKADGSFKFDGLLHTNFEGVVNAPGYVLSFFRAGTAGKPLEIHMRPTPTGDELLQTVRGRVVDSRGEPVKGAKIQVHMVHTQRDWHSGGGLAYTDQEGEFVFRAGENLIGCDFTIEASGHVPRSFNEVPPGPNTNEYRLSNGTILTGRLVKDGKPVPDAGIGIYGVKGGGFINHDSVVTDMSGRFTFSGLAPHKEFYLFGIMQSLRELGALPRQRIKTGDDGTLIELGDLNLIIGYTIAGRVQMVGGKPTPVGAFTLARTELTPPADRAPTKEEESNRSFYGLEDSFDNWRADPGKDGKFEFVGVPGETVSIFLMLKPFDTLSPRNISSDGKGFRLLGMVVSNKTDLVIELEPHSKQVFPPARNFEALSRKPLQGAEAAIAK